MALLLEFTVAELLCIMIAELELELICVPLELEAAELLLDTGIRALELEPVCVPLELEATELLLDTGIRALELEFVCMPLLAGLVTLLEESPISGSLPVLPPSHDARTKANESSDAAIPQLRTPGMLNFFVPGFTLPVGPPQNKSI